MAEKLSPGNLRGAPHCCHFDSTVLSLRQQSDSNLLPCRPDNAILELIEPCRLPRIGSAAILTVGRDESPH